MMAVICACWPLVAEGLPSAQAWGPDWASHRRGDRVGQSVGANQDEGGAAHAAGPPKAGLASLFPQDARPLDLREREFFITRSTWPDIVRSATSLERFTIRRGTIAAFT
jgi:hypothetical protein